MICVRETLQCVLTIIYSGKCHVSSTAQGKEIRQIMSLLDLKLPGDLKQETGGLESSVLHTPSSSQSSRLETGAKRKRSEETASRHDLLGSEESQTKGFFFKPSLKNKSTVFSVGVRDEVLGAELEAPIIVPHAGQNKDTRSPYEMLFR